ncbi:MAG: hypothetical protein PHR25_01020 [Clostridia bacterium]|nr:hypothetical protein [Clostridia bacterium]
MKILYVLSTPIEYSLSANIRNIALIKGFIENGHTVDLVSDSFDINSKYVDTTLCDIKFNYRYYLRKQTFEKTPVNNNNKKIKFSNKLKSHVLKFINSISVYDNRKILIKNVKNIKFNTKYDLIISSSDPKSSHLIAKQIINSNPSITKKWIQYWGDPFAIDINRSKWVTKRRVKHKEKNILKLADEIIYVSPFTLENQQKTYKALSSRMHFLPIPYIKEKLYDNTRNKSYIVSYFGDYKSNDRNILPLYDSIKKMKVKLNICGNSDVSLGNTSNIEILPRQPYKKIEELESRADLLVVICNKSGTQIPGKVYHYAATNKPILIILDGSKEEKEKLLKYFDGFNRYEVCYNNEEDITNAISRIIKEKKEYLPLADLKAEKISAEFINLCERK